MYPFVMGVFMLYLSVISIYTVQYSIKLKTLDNIEHDYDRLIKTSHLKEDRIAKNIRLPLILIGFMGAGKTTLGEYIASTYQLSYVDLDHYIVEQEQMTIPTIFKQYGEQHFRRLEAHYLQECIQQFEVIATGGGIIEGAQSIEILHKQSNIVWLDCDLNIVYDRIRNDPNRPNANNKSLYDLKTCIQTDIQDIMKSHSSK